MNAILGEGFFGWSVEREDFNVPLNKDEILENRSLIEVLSEKLDKIFEKLDSIPVKE